MSGGGVALLYASKALESLQTQNEDQKRGVEIIKHALKVSFKFFHLQLLCVYEMGFSLHLLTAFHQAPVHTISSNAGFDGALVLGKLLEQDNHYLGFDAAKGLSLTPCGDPNNSLCSFSVSVVSAVCTLSLSFHSSLEYQINLHSICFRRG